MVKAPQKYVSHLDANVGCGCADDGIVRLNIYGLYSDGLDSYGLCSYDLDNNGLDEYVGCGCADDGIVCLYGHDLCSYGPYSCGLCSDDLGLCSYGLYSDDVYGYCHSSAFEQRAERGLATHVGRLHGPQLHRP